jgi:hypothetical protein
MNFDPHFNSIDVLLDSTPAPRCYGMQIRLPSNINCQGRIGKSETESERVRTQPAAALGTHPTVSKLMITHFVTELYHPVRSDEIRR